MVQLSGKVVQYSGLVEWSSGVVLLSGLEWSSRVGQYSGQVEWSNALVQRSGPVEWSRVVQLSGPEWPSLCPDLASPLAAAPLNPPIWAPQQIKQPYL